MSNEISNERLEMISKYDTFVSLGEAEAMAKELLALRKAFNVPDCWEIAGHIFATEDEALSYGFIGKPEPLYSKPEA
ncbi:hypothetical protein PQD17_gp34 [Pantoea phage PdC23]|uniref:Uncharacterized protein n=1 Tax=Pantoea phage PdC23 TaxID=2894356 RepID=A0AAE8YIX7_9CAUD|nr:hypothetical protein PQD17_gp34 [Pantoea phage PdC23]UGC97747.1 hypothetical protein pdc_034 [Pantoea phage PdC23]